MGLWNDGSIFDAKNFKMIELFIETLQGTAFELRVSPLDSVADVKARICKVEGMCLRNCINFALLVLWRQGKIEAPLGKLMELGLHPRPRRCYLGSSLLMCRAMARPHIELEICITSFSVEQNMIK